MEKFIELLALRMLDKLPGVEAHVQMAPFPGRLTEEPSGDHTKAAVMILLMPDSNKLLFPLIQRNPLSKLDPHKGQIALPGGRYEAIDGNMVFTALRETQEEIGISSSLIQVIGAMSPLYIPVSKNLVFPYIGYCREVPSFVKQDSEIHEIFSCSIEDILNNDHIHHRIINTSYATDLKVPGFLVNDRWIWGATAMILAELKEILANVKSV